ncbi:TcfC E-set like domain-containing protein [bacterium]|nr:TcfC E-set like domain-containing protein [bacterium]
MSRVIFFIALLQISLVAHFVKAEENPIDPAQSLKEYTAFDIFLGDAFKGIAMAYYSDTAVKLERPHEVLELLGFSGKEAANQVLKLLTDPIESKKSVPHIGSISVDSKTFRIVLRLEDEFLDTEKLAAKGLIKPTSDEVSLRTDFQAVYAKSAEEDQSLFSNLTDYGFNSGWLRANAAKSNVDNRDDIREISANYILGRWILSGGLIDTAGAELIPSTFLTGISLRTEPLLYESSDALRGNSFQINVPTRATVEFFKEGQLIDRQVLESGKREVDTTRFPQGGYYVDVVVRELAGGERRERKFFSKSGFLTTRGGPQLRFDIGKLREEADLLDIPYYRSSLEWRLFSPLQLNLATYGTDDKQTGVVGVRATYGDFLLTTAGSWSSNDKFSYTIGGGGALYGISFSADHEKSELVPIDELERREQVGEGFNQSLTPIDNLFNPVTAREGERTNVYISKWIDDLELRFNAINIKRDDEPAFETYGPTIRYRILEDAKNSLYAEASYQVTKESDLVLAFISWQRRFLPWSIDSTAGLRTVQSNNEAGSVKDDFGPMLREAVQYDARNSKTAQGLRARLDALMRDQESGSLGTFTTSQVEYGSNYGGLLAALNHQQDSNQSQDSEAIGANLSMALSSQGKLTTGPAGLGDALISVEIVNPDSAAATDIIIDGQTVKTIHGAGKVLIGVSAFQKYSVRIKPAVNSPVMSYDNKTYQVLLYPGHVQRLTFDVAKVFVAIGKIVDSNDQPLASKRIKGLREFPLTEIDGSFQVEVNGHEEISVEINAGESCHLKLPEVGEVEYFYDYGTLKCL